MRYNRPITNCIYTTEEVLGLELDDYPCFVNNDEDVIIEHRGDLTRLEYRLWLLDNYAGWRWKFLRVNREWIPIFQKV